MNERLFSQRGNAPFVYRRAFVPIICCYSLHLWAGFSLWYVAINWHIRVSAMTRMCYATWHIRVISFTHTCQFRPWYKAMKWDLFHHLFYIYYALKVLHTPNVVFSLSNLTAVKHIPARLQIYFCTKHIYVRMKV